MRRCLDFRCPPFAETQRGAAGCCQVFCLRTGITAASPWGEGTELSAPLRQAKKKNALVAEGTELAWTPVLPGEMFWDSTLKTAQHLGKGALSAFEFSVPQRGIFLQLYFEVAWPLLNTAVYSPFSPSAAASRRKAERVTTKLPWHGCLLS